MFSFAKFLIKVLIFYLCIDVHHRSFIVDIDAEWKVFKLTFNKTYSSKLEDDEKRKKFEQNLVFIIKHNVEADMGRYSYYLGINKLSDMNATEYKNWSKCFEATNFSTNSYNYSHLLFLDDVPQTLDYRDHGLVGSVNDQGGCHACYAFAATAALAAQTVVVPEVPITELSAQNIIDCSTKEGNNGCYSGNMINSYKYVIDNKGVDTRHSYPYEEKENECRFNAKTVGGICDSYYRINGEYNLFVVVASTAPVSASINAELPTYQFYKRGVYDDKHCNGNLNSAVLIIGYGTENGKEYWLLQNSYGEDWGENGFAKIARGKNMCGIANDASFTGAVLKKQRNAKQLRTLRFSGHPNTSDGH